MGRRWWPGRTSAEQCGVRSDTAPPGWYCAPKGQTRVVRVHGRCFGVGIGSEPSSRRALWFTVFTGTFDAGAFLRLLDLLACGAGRKIHVIADGHPVHRSKAVKACPESNGGRTEMHLMPVCNP
ncbi:transposase [Streptomyces erythrochromogenes]|uniref:transposase n=1 Tax=Streptomyces erythrochromogenes TaxID=285574 RepID=UPI00368CC913